HDCGDIIIGSNTLLSKDELKKAVDTKSQRIFWWSTSCDGEFWLEDVPWSGYAAQKSHKNRESLASHWGVRDLTSRANAISDSLTRPYKTNTMDNEQTDSSLSFPRLTDDILEKFRLVPYNQLVPDPLSTSTARSSQKASDTMREIMHAHTFEWPLEVDKDELLDLATPLLDYVPIPTSCNLQRIRRNLLKEDSSPGDIQILWNIFKHRQLCQRAIEMFLTYGPWGQTRAPDWNEFRTGKKLSRYFMEDNWESSNQLFIAYEWECMIDNGSSWPSLGFPEVWEQLALSWDLAGRPSFSFEEFQSVINQVHILKSSRICTHASYQVFSNWLDLHYATPELQEYYHIFLCALWVSLYNICNTNLKALDYLSLQRQFSAQETLPLPTLGA
ncbi:hypothetical protein BDP27DRAFT_1517435, partial [Rhodocollybia butyracea]